MTTDLLTLIGRAIERLQRCVALFETSERDTGAEHLAAVIEEIDDYIEIADEDPLLLLASLPSERVREGLLNVRTDLASVIDELHRAGE
ncbi:MAG: hypothetical protein WBC63_08490 [Candidatus Bipolaricaulia bacterium]